MEKLKNSITHTLYRLVVPAVVFSSLWLVSCDYDRNTPGWQYFDDMAQSPAYETYYPQPQFQGWENHAATGCRNHTEGG